MNAEKPLLSALKGVKQQVTPIWVMRQAGRYLPEYRAIREKHDFLSVCHNPELACEVTLQPLRRFNMDGAILFSDILIPLEPMGMKLKFGKDHGPMFENPIENKGHVEQLKIPPGEACSFVGDALELIKKEIPATTTLLGFAGAPFTLASYMVEGRGSKNYLKIKKLMYNHPDVYEALMDKLVKSTINYLEMQVEKGADALQLFDSWGGQLSPEDYAKYSFPYSQKIIQHMQNAGTPMIHFVKNGGGLYSVLQDEQAKGMGVSWEVNMQEAVERLPKDKCLQGNLDPVALFADEATLRHKVQAILDVMAQAPQSHIFNLGHGILPPTPIESLEILLDTIRG